MKTITILAIALILTNCDKKKTTVKPATTTQTQASTTTHCWYQVINGSQLFYRCTNTQAEYTDFSIWCATNQMNMVVKQKNTCAEC